jgi:hypothetical protein
MKKRLLNMEFTALESCDVVEELASTALTLA